MVASTKPHTLLTGRPGVGKTNVIMRLAQCLNDQVVAGFYTEEIRCDAHRQGFRAMTFSGQDATLAHVGLRSRSRVGRYGVDAASFERLVTPELARPCDLMLIDEIGKMECFSTAFLAAVKRLLDGATPVIATVASKGAGFIADVKARNDVELIEVTLANRDELPRRLAERFDT